VLSDFWALPLICGLFLGVGSRESGVGSWELGVRGRGTVSSE
jgi:hypothetical protein